MRQKHRHVPIIVALLVVLAGCGPGPNGQDHTPGLQTPSTSLNELTVTPTAGDGAISPVEEAPAYEEIERAVSGMVESSELGLAAGPDGYLDDALFQAVEDYAQSLRGKKVTNWRGWHLEHTQSMHRGTYQHMVTLLMQEPVAGTRYMSNFVDLYIKDPTPEQEKIIDSLQYGDPVIFSGVFGDVHPTMIVSIEAGAIALAK